MNSSGLWKTSEQRFGDGMNDVSETDKVNMEPNVRLSDFTDTIGPRP